MVTAIKNGTQRNFSDTQWKSMPKDKYGWTQISPTKAATTPIPIPEEIIQKKMVRGDATVKNTEPEVIKKTKKDVATNKQKD